MMPGSPRSAAATQRRHAAPGAEGCALLRARPASPRPAQNRGFGGDAHADGLAAFAAAPGCDEQTVEVGAEPVGAAIQFAAIHDAEAERMFHADDKEILLTRAPRRTSFPPW